MIGASFVSSEINKGDFGEGFFSILDVDLHDSMGPGWISISGILRGDPECTSLFNDIKELIGRINGFFLQSNDVNIGVFIFPNFELGPVCQ